LRPQDVPSDVHVLRHVDWENYRSTQCAHTPHIDGGEATNLPWPDTPHNHLHLALKQY
jgi:hypothetical protein